MRELGVGRSEFLLRLGNYAEARDEARKVLGGARSGATRIVAEFILFAALILDGKYAESQEYFANFLPYLQDSAARVAEPDYYVRGLTKRLQEHQDDPISQLNPEDSWKAFHGLIQMAVGSQRIGIVRPVLLSGMKFAIAGCVLGLAGAMAGSRLLESFTVSIKGNETYRTPIFAQYLSRMRPQKGSTLRVDPESEVFFR